MYAASGGDWPLRRNQMLITLALVSIAPFLLVAILALISKAIG